MHAALKPFTLASMCFVVVRCTHYYYPLMQTAHIHLSACIMTSVVQTFMARSGWIYELHTLLRFSASVLEPSAQERFRTV